MALPRGVGARGGWRGVCQAPPPRRGAGRGAAPPGLRAPERDKCARVSGARSAPSAGFGRKLWSPIEFPRAFPWGRQGAQGASLGPEAVTPEPKIPAGVARPGPLCPRLQRQAGLGLSSAPAAPLPAPRRGLKGKASAAGHVAAAGPAACVEGARDAWRVGWGERGAGGGDVLCVSRRGLAPRGAAWEKREGRGRAGAMAAWTPDPSPGPAGHSSPGAGAWPPEASEDPAEAGEPCPVAQVQMRKQNAITERERRKRISVSCERLRILLPKFEGRREDMASILEMAVQYLKLARTLVPTEEQSTILAPSEEVCQKWQKNVLIPNTRKQISEMRGLDTARQRGSPGRLATPVENSKPALMLGESVDNAFEDTRSVFEKGLSDPALLPPDLSLSDNPAHTCETTPSLPWPYLLPPTFPLETSAMGRWPSLAGLFPGEAMSQSQLPGNTHEPSDVLMTPPLDTRSLSESEVEDEMPFLLGAHTDQWLGEQGPQDAKSGETQTCFMSTPFMMDTKTGSQDGLLTKSDLEILPEPESCLPESQKSLLDHLEFDSTSVALTPEEEVDSIFPCLFPYDL
ncbi:spermatogenesis- and oogenesis-specific basic helix-loop-helix-containing protein 1 [Macrotis lagotis]|uniref:spermatogenesis- and oogenesis-specific basic helix-loop-helix-containing protein 1 n=1 Tax=Macrotis lagotis TaxID=92651 RepID=UPI003D6856DE